MMFSVDIPDFYADANRRFRSEHLSLAPDAATYLQDIYSKAKRRLERRLESERPESIQEAIDNHEKFLDELVHEAHEHHTKVIQRSLIDSVRGRLCPLFPIC